MLHEMRHELHSLHSYGMPVTHRTELLACVAVLLATWLSVSTMDYRYAVERENDGLKSENKRLKAQLADPPRLCREYYRKLLKGKK